MKLLVRKRYFIVSTAVLLWWALDTVRWSRWEDYDQTSPDGQYTIKVYGDNFHFGMAMGGGADRKAKGVLPSGGVGYNKVRLKRVQVPFRTFDRCIKGFHIDAHVNVLILRHDYRPLYARSLITFTATP